MLAPRIGINQGSDGGSDYPFVANGDLQPVILDCYISIEQPRCFDAYPLSMEITATDINVKDADDNLIIGVAIADAVVTPWGTDREIYSWLEPSAVFRLVKTTATFPLGTQELDNRTINWLPRRVKGIKIGTQVFTGNVAIRNGYNLDLLTASTVRNGRTESGLTFDARPGNGIGLYPGCEDTSPVIRTINRVAPDPAGNFRLEVDPCLRITSPTRFTGVVPYTADYYHSTLDAVNAKSALQLTGACKPRCEDIDYVNTYRGLTRVWNGWQAVATQLESIRDTYDDNRTRWDEYRQCRIANPLRLVTVPEPECKTSLMVSYCNLTTCCIRDVEIRFTFEWFLDGVKQTTTPPGVCIIDPTLTGAGSGRTERRYSPIIPNPTTNWPIVRFVSPFANAQQTTLVKFRFCLPCAANVTFRVTVTVHIGGVDVDANGQTCNIPTVSVPTDIQALWAPFSLPTTTRVNVNRVVPTFPGPRAISCECI